MACAVAPREYLCRRARTPPRLDGLVNGSAWDEAPWSDEFQDILGNERGPKPRYSTRCKMRTFNQFPFRDCCKHIETILGSGQCTFLNSVTVVSDFDFSLFLRAAVYDENYLYVGAVLEDPHVWGTLTEKNSVVFHDNDFEIFIDPDNDGRNYYEFEINALGTVWELSLDKPYSVGGTPRSGNNLPGLISNVYVNGELNNPASASEDVGWSVTVALPLGDTGLGQFGAASSIAPGMAWRANFSRVQWDFRIVEDESNRKRYERVPPHGTQLPQGSNHWHPEKNWVWSPQAEVNMHAPETWGWIRFI
jgi:hypothetical protein